MSEEKYLRIKEVVKLSGYTATSIRRMTDTGQLECIRTETGERLFTMKAVEQLKARKEAKIKEFEVWARK